MPSKKRSEKKSKIWSGIRSLLVSAGKGSVETAKLFKSNSQKETQKLPHSQKDQEVSEEAPSNTPKEKKSGKLRNYDPKFQDFKVEKEILGDYPTFQKRLHQDSKIVLIFGKRGSGKSALGLRILENIKATTKRNCYALGIKEDVLPSWITTLQNIHDAETESIVLIDEGAISFNSRESMKDKHKELSKIMAIARHKNLTMLFITQNTGLIDKNVLKLADSLMIKEGSLLQVEMERLEIKKFYLKAKESLENIQGNKVKYLYLVDADFEGLLTHELPSFWSQELSKNKSSF